jgi:hypothetical protein
MGHDQGADQACGYPPGGCPCIDFLAVGILELDVLGFGEVLAQEVGGARLEGLPVLHDRFDGEGLHRTGESFGSGFFAFDDRHGHVLLGKLGIEVQHPAGFGHGLLGGGMHGMSLLPQKLGGPEKHPGPHFPTDHIGPLVDQDGQVLIGLDPAGKRGSDDRFAGRPNDQRLLQFADRAEFAIRTGLQPMVRYHRTLLGKPFDVFGFLLQEAERDKQGEIGVFMAGLFELPVQHPLDVFPDGITPLLNHHTAAHIGRLGQIGRPNHLLIPLGIIFHTCGRNGGFWCFCDIWIDPLEQLRIW